MQKLENKIPAPVKVAVKYGFFMALLLGAVFISLFYAGRHPFVITTIIYDVMMRVLLTAIFLYFAIKEFRDYENKGELHFWQGMLTGMVLTVTVGVFLFLVIILFGDVEENLLAAYKTEMTSYFMDNKERLYESVGEEVYHVQLNKLASITIGDLAITYLVQCLGIGLFLSIIISIILRRHT